MYGFQGVIRSFEAGFAGYHDLASHMLKPRPTSLMFNTQQIGKPHQVIIITVTVLGMRCCIRKQEPGRA